MKNRKQAAKQAVKRNCSLKRTASKLGKVWMLACFCLFLSGCSSIIYNGNLKIEPYEPETVPPVWDEPEYEPDIMSFTEDGKPAFYILDGHESDPSQMAGFKLLDLIDGSITIYAYATPYHGSEESGLPGGQTTGKAIFKKNPDQGENGRAAAGDAANPEPIVTVLMAYHTDSETYQVFFCKVSNTKENKSTDLASMLSAQTETGVTANKVGEAYFLYHAGIGYLFSKDGQQLSEQNLTEVLNENILRYQAGSKNSVTISDVIMDVDQRIYVPMVIENANIGSYDDLTEKDLANEDGKVRKVICCCFHLNAGKDNEPPVFFTSLNANAEKQEALWCESAEKGEHRLSINEVKQIYPDQFHTFYLNQTLALQLCGFSPRESNWLSWYWIWQTKQRKNPTAIEPYNANQFTDPWSVVMAYNSKIKKYYYIKNPHGKKINYSDYSNSFLHYINILANYGASGNWFDSMEPVKKTISRTYTTVESETDENGAVTETTVEHEEEAQITVEYRLHMKAGTELFSSVDWWTSNIMAPGTNGLIHYGTNEGEKTSFFIYSFSEQNAGNSSGFSSSNIPQKQILGESLPGYALTAGSIDFPGGECVALFTSKGIAILKILTGREHQHSELEQYFIPYSNLDFRKNRSGNPDQYGTQSLAFDGKMILFFSLYNGVVMIHPDTLESVQLDTGAYYAAFLQPSGDYAVIGFRTSENVAKCTPADLSKARIYSISLDTGDAALQIVKSRLKQDPTLRDEIASGKQGDEFIEKWKLSAYKKEISAYFSSLREEKRKQEQGIADFFRLTGLKENQEIKAELLNCHYLSSIEDLIVKYITKNSLDSIQPQQKEQSRYEILSELKRRRGLSNEEWNTRIQNIISQIHAYTDE